MGMETTGELWRSCYLTVANGCKEKWLGVRPWVDKREKEFSRRGRRDRRGPPNKVSSCSLGKIVAVEYFVPIESEKLPK